MSEVLSIRNPEDLDNFPGLVEIREAIIYAFETISNKNEVNAFERALQAISLVFMLEKPGFKSKPIFKADGKEDFSYADLIRFLNSNNLLPLDDENTERAIEILSQHFQTSAFCKEASNLVVRNLKNNTSFEGEVYLISTTNNSSTKYFLNHYGVIVHLDNHFYYVSGANIFNMNLKTPKLKNVSFDRSVNVLHAFTYNDLINQLEALEGGHWPSHLELIFQNEALKNSA